MMFNILIGSILPSINNIPMFTVKKVHPFVCHQFHSYPKIYTYQSYQHSTSFNHSYGHLLVITGYKWDYTVYKWGFVTVVLISGKGP